MNIIILRRKIHSIRYQYLRRSVRLLMSLVLLLGMASLSGCAGLHFYNPGNDATASLVKKTSDEISFKAVIEEERKNQAKLLTHELDVVAQSAQAKRNTKLRALLEDKEKPGTSEVELLSIKQEQLIKERLLKLVGAKDLKEISNKIFDLNRSREILATSIETFEDLLPVSAPICDIGFKSKFIITEEMIKKYQAIANSAKKNIDIQAELEEYKTDCIQYQEDWKALANSGGIFNTIAKKEDEALTNLDEQKKEAKDALTAYNNALKAYNDALIKAEMDASKVAKEAITNNVEKLQTALDTLAKAGALGKHAAAESQIKKIDLILDVLAKGRLDEEKLKCSDIKSDKEKKKCLNTKQALTMVAQLPSIAGRLTTIEALTQLPPINALLFEKERLMALKKDAENQIGRTNSRIALLQQQREAASDEIDSLMKSMQHLDWARKANGNSEIKLSDLYQKSINESARRHMVIATTRYLNTFIGPQRLMHEIDYRLIDIEHAQALDASETALRLWEVAIKQPITVLAAYHGSGIKREELAKLIIEALKAAGLFAIAGGVIN